MQRFGEKVSFLWSVADLPRGDYKQSEYGRVILPCTVLRRLDQVLEPAREKVRAAAAKHADAPPALRERMLRRAAGEIFYHQAEVDLFARVFFKPGSEKLALDNARLNAALDPAVDRFAALEEEPAETFRGKLQAFCNLYGFLAQIVPSSTSISRSSTRSAACCSRSCRGRTRGGRSISAMTWRCTTGWIGRPRARSS